MTDFHPENVQGNILRGYTFRYVRHLMLEVGDRATARAFLAAAADGTRKEVPRITNAVAWPKDRNLWPKVCFNIGITITGLSALGQPANELATFPTEFVDGMAKRAPKLGDFGESAPEKWPSPFDQPDRIHLIASIHANAIALLEEVQQQVAKAFIVLGVRDGRNLADGKVFFGYKDGISQPRFKGISDPTLSGVDELQDPLGTVLLGYPTQLDGVAFLVPTPKEHFRDSAFNAFRVLQQNTDAFEDYLTTAARTLENHDDTYKLLPEGAEKNIGGGMSRLDALREVVAAQMCGRWRNGAPYELSPNSDRSPNSDKYNGSLTNFDYNIYSRCPAGAHTRRANPRSGPIVQRIANHSRRLVRRGMSYGPETGDGEQGLLGNFIGAIYGAQFEAVLCDWINFGLQDPNITGTNDPLLGANEPTTSAFDLRLCDGGRIRLTGFPRFVITRGGAYTLLPSLSAIKYLAQLKG